MNKQLCITTLLILVAGIFSAVAAPPPGAPTVDDPEAWDPFFPKSIEKIKTGKIHVEALKVKKGEIFRGVTAGFIVKANIKQAYEAMKQPEKQIQYLKMLEYTEVIERTDSSDTVRFRVKFLAWDITYQIRDEYDNENYRFKWSLDPDFKNGFVRFDGQYRFYYIDDDHTLVRYTVVVRFLEYVPNSIQQLILRYDMPNGLGEVRKWMESNGTYKVERKGGG